MNATHVFFDLGGPVMDDSEVEKSRALFSLGAANVSGISYKILMKAQEMYSLGREYSLTVVREFLDVYEDAKTSLKKVAKEAEAYNDINRVAMVFALAANHAEDYRSLIEHISDAERCRFWKELCQNLDPSVYSGLREEFFDVVSDISYEATGIHIATDNWPDLYLGAIDPSLKRKAEEARAKGANVPDFTYRRYRIHRLYDSLPESRAYISGEGWGNKKKPESWRRILNDLHADASDTIVFVDDSREKLRGLELYGEQSGLKPVLVQFGGVLEQGDKILRMDNISLIKDIVKDHARGKISR